MRGIYTIPPHIGFARALAQGLWERAACDPMRLSEMLVLLPTRRACRHVRDAFALINGAEKQATLLPRLSPIGDVDEDELNFLDADAVDDMTMPPALSPLRRHMLLTQLVMKKDGTLSLDQAALLAESLGRLLDEAAIAERDLRGLVHIVDDVELAAHWQQTVEFLDILTQQWPLILAAENAMDATVRRGLMLRKQAAAWRAHPPTTPVIVAGSTGSVPAAADLIATVAALPQGVVVLPGCDTTMADDAWDALDETHPQYGMKNLLNAMKVERHVVHVWGDYGSANTARTRLLQAAMLPAAVTDTWRSLCPADFPAEDLRSLTRIELENPEEEAAVIALRLRAALEDPTQTAALITPDRSLAERVTAALGRWNIVADDSAGSSLAHHPAGSFLDHILAACAPHASSVAMLSLLKHPLAAAGRHPAECRAMARAMEIALWRNSWRNPPRDDEPVRDTTQAATESLAEINALLSPLRDAWHKFLPLEEWLDHHRHVAEHLAASSDETGGRRLWQGAAGEKTALWLDEWRNAAATLPPMTGDDYAALFTQMIRRVRFRPAYGKHPRLAILGPLEARLVQADMVILGGLNEGTWPAETTVDPWMSRPMKHKFGLALPEQRIGLSAHDFVQLASAPVVMLTRARRNGTAPTVPSRFLLQVDTVLIALGYIDRERHKDVLTAPEPWAAWARMLDEPESVQSINAPAPCPPKEARPRTLSVTRITTWLRNPYEIYARYILRLRKLDDLEKPVDAAERGTMLHGALEEFIRRHPVTLPPNALQELLDIGAAHFAARHEHPQVQAIWWPRFKRLAAWFIDTEHARRRACPMQSSVEITGATTLGDFTLTGRADRIDKLERDKAHPTLAIIDYKSGAPPSKKSVESGLEPQLPLLALIAQRGGFDATGLKAAATDELAYWKIGGKTGGETKPFDIPIAPLVAKAERGLTALIAAYDDPAMPYLVTPRPTLAPRHDDYAHLARRAEWGHVTEGDDEF